MNEYDAIEKYKTIHSLLNDIRGTNNNWKDDLFLDVIYGRITNSPVFIRRLYHYSNLQLVLLLSVMED